MSALALILVKKGYSISGSDICVDQATNELSKAGIKIFSKQEPKNIDLLFKIFKKTPTIVISSAIKNTNNELQKAKEKNLTILHRSDILGFLTKQQPSILIAGSHGKTTTSTIITTLLSLNKQDPTAVIGGIVPLYKSNARSGKGKYLVAEADESDGTLIKLKGEIGVITNLELDHTDFYKSMHDLQKIIKIFSKKCERVIVNYDSINLRNIFENKTIFYSIKKKKGIDFSAIPIYVSGNGTVAEYYEQGDLIDVIEIPLLGDHNLSNVIAALSVCRNAGIPFIDLKNNIKNIVYPKRRFDYKGIWEGKKIIDDYAHHPTEIKATLNMARLMINNKWQTNNFVKRIIVVFQPHRYSRTNDLMKEFSTSFDQADSIFILPIYSAGEKPIKGVTSKNLVALIEEKKPKSVVKFAKDYDTLKMLLKVESKKDDLILFLGAGDINKLSENLILDKKIENCAA